MANNIINKQPKIFYNSIEDQKLTHNHQFTLKSWNDTINLLKTQSNCNATVLQELVKWLLGNEQGAVIVPSSESFAEFVLNNIQSITTDPTYVHLFKINENGNLVVQVHNKDELHNKKYFIDDNGILCIQLEEE